MTVPSKAQSKGINATTGTSKIKLSKVDQAKNPAPVSNEGFDGIINPGAKIDLEMDGSFSVHDWNGYPEGGIKPSGPFRLLEGAEYSAARKLANSTNMALRRADPITLKGLQIHEIHPIKFGGSPTDINNKIFLTPQEHRSYNSFWFKLQNSIK